MSSAVRPAAGPLTSLPSPGDDVLAPYAYGYYAGNGSTYRPCLALEVDRIQASAHFHTILSRGQMGKVEGGFYGSGSRDGGTELGLPTGASEIVENALVSIINFTNVLKGAGWGAAIQSPSVNQSIPEIGAPELLEDHLDRLYSDARDEVFEVGRTSQFSKGLQQMCTYAPVAVMQSLRVRLADDRISAEVLAETLRWAADQEVIAIRDSVMAFLSMGLGHPSSLVRDAAALGLAYLDEDAAITPLRHALEREDIPELREDLEALIHSLEG